MEGGVALVVFALFTALTVLVAVPAQLLAWPFDPDRRVAAAVTGWTWGRLLFAAQPFWRVRVTGRERLAGPACIVVANHQSVLDIPLLLSVGVPLRLTARPGVFRMPVFGVMARFGGHVSVGEETDLDAVVDRVRRLLDRGIHVVVFPEGTRSDGRALGVFRRGAFELALRCGVEVLPVCIRGTADAVPPGGWRPRRAGPRFHVQILPRIPSVGQTRRGLARAAAGAVEGAFAAPDPFHLRSLLFAAYRPLGRFAAGFAAGKTAADPVFWAAWERLPRRGLLVDVGGGEGLLGGWLRACGSEVQVWGVDPDAGRVAQARATGRPGDVWVVGDARTVALPEGAAAVVCLDVLHYLSVEEQGRLLARLVDALAPGGVLLVRDPEPGRGLRSRWTQVSERLLVAVGRHRGERVVVTGGAAIAARLAGRLAEVRVEDASVGWFANCLVWGRKG